MKEYQMFFFDVDGTLLDNRNHRISPAVMEALTRLQKNGKKIVISSGRDVNTILTMPQLAAIAWDGYICRNGSVIADAQKTELFRVFFDQATMAGLEAVSAQLRSPIQYMGHDDWLNCPPTPDFIARPANSFTAIRPRSTSGRRGQTIRRRWRWPLTQRTAIMRLTGRFPV